MRKLSRLAVVVMLPAVLAHELTHAIAARPVGRVEGIALWPPHADIWYPAGTHTLAVRAVSLAPTILGTLILAAYLAADPALLLALEVPVQGYLAGSWLIYTTPSNDDLHPFANAG